MPGMEKAMDCRKAGSGLFLKLIVAVLLVGCTEVAAQQGQYPTRSVKMIVPLPAGSSPDIRHRLIARQLTQLWGQQVIVENRPGGGGVIGTRAVVAGDPDGYTLLVALASIYTILPAQEEKLPFDVNSDLIPIGLTSSEGMVLAVSPKLGIDSLSELIALAKRKPDQLIIGTNPVGSLPHLAAHLFVDLSKAPMTVVPYSRGGTNDAIKDIMGGHVHAVIEGLPGLKGSLDAGELKALAIMSPEPLPTIPNLPAASSTVPGLTAVGWQVLAAPKGTPEAIIRKLTLDLHKVLDDPELQRRLLETGSAFKPLFGAELTRFIKDDEQTWWPLVKKYGVN
jgi:tripartite-type tricarboxylate transporter receptor subunit TctC